MRNKINCKLCILTATIMVPAMLALSGCGKQSDTLVLSGTVESTQIEVNSEVQGKILKLEKDEGSKVQKNDILAVVDASTQEFTVKQQEALVKLKQAKLDELKAGTRTEQIKQAEATVDAARAGLNTARTAVDNTRVNYEYWVDKYNRAKSLHDSGATSDTDLNDAKYKMDTANQQLISAQKQLESSQAQLQSSQAQLELLRNGSTNQAIRAAEADLEQSQAALDQAKLVLGRYQIKSPIDGTYLIKNVNIGDVVNNGVSIGTVSDLTDLWVKVYIPQRNINAVKLNQEINLKTLSLPGKTIKGKIIFIASEAEYTPKNTETAEAKENTVFKLKIKILDNIESLKPGMTMDAVIPLK